MKRSPFPRWKLMLFALLSGADLALTYSCVGRAETGLYESNPLAQWWLNQFGWAGLAVFKALMVGLIAVLAFAIWIRRPKRADRILTFGCGAAGAVVLYSCYLILAVHGPLDVFEPGEQAAFMATERRLDDQRRVIGNYQRALGGLRKELVAGRCTLGEAADRLARTELACDAAWLQKLRNCYPGLTDRAALAACAAKFTLGALDCPADHPLARRLSAELYDLCGVEVSMDLAPTRPGSPAVGAAPPITEAPRPAVSAL
jgi:Domain of unknown function (DUF5658)